MVSKVAFSLGLFVVVGFGYELSHFSFSDGEGADHKHYECCTPSFYGNEEKDAIKKWYQKVASSWDDVYEKEFLLWNEFDIQRASKDEKFVQWADAIKDIDVSPEKIDTWLDSPVPFCKSSMQDVRWNMGYQYAKDVPDMVDWDDKISKKAMVVAVQPRDDKILWYTPNIYAGYFSGFAEENQLQMMEMAVATFFESNPDDLVFLKSAVAGMGGQGLQTCNQKSSTPGALFKLARADFLADSANDRYPVLRACAKLVLKSIETLAPTMLGQGVNPAIEHGWGGLIVEPGFPHVAEFKTVIIWGKFFAAGTETPHCCGFRTADFTPMRGDKTFGIDNTPDTRSYASHMAKVNDVVTEEVWKRLVMIAENSASHADYARVDLFVNDKGEVRVNEIEGYYQCKHTALQQNDVAVALQAALWVRGWQRFLKQKENARETGKTPNLQVALRQFAREQTCVATARGGNLKQVKEVFPVWVLLLLIILLLGLIASSVALAVTCRKLKRISAPQDIRGVELTIT